MSSGPSLGSFRTLNRGQRGALSDLIGLIGPQIGQGGPVFPGEVVPGPSRLQQQAFLGAANFAADPLSVARNASLLEQINRGRPEVANQFFTEAIENPALRTFNEQILPQTFERFAGGGFGRSGAVLGAGRRAAEGFGSNLAAQRAQFQLQAGQQATGAGQAALQSQLAQQGLLGQFGDIQRQIQAQQQQEAQQRFLAAQPFANPALQFLPLILGTPTRQPVLS